MSRRLALIAVTAAGAVVAYAWYRSWTVDQARRERGRPPDSEPAPRREDVAPVQASAPELEAEPELEPIAVGTDAEALAEQVEEPEPEPVSRPAGEPLAIVGELLGMPAADGRRPRRSLARALARSRSVAAVGGVVVLINLVVVAGLATTHQFEHLSEWMSSLLSVFF